MPFPACGTAIGGVNRSPDDSISELERLGLRFGIHAHSERHDPVCQVRSQIGIKDAVQLRETVGNAVQVSFQSLYVAIIGHDEGELEVIARTRSRIVNIDKNEWPVGRFHKIRRVRGIDPLPWPGKWQPTKIIIDYTFGPTTTSPGRSANRTHR